MTRFDKRDKLSPRYIGPFEVLERVGTFSYRLALPPSLSSVHAVFVGFLLAISIHTQRKKFKLSPF